MWIQDYLNIKDQKIEYSQLSMVSLVKRQTNLVIQKLPQALQLRRLLGQIHHSKFHVNQACFNKREMSVIFRHLKPSNHLPTILSNNQKCLSLLDMFNLNSKRARISAQFNVRTKTFSRSKCRYLLHVASRRGQK